MQLNPRHLSIAIFPSCYASLSIALFRLALKYAGASVNAKDARRNNVGKNSGLITEQNLMSRRAWGID
jgi:hypothetical protein